MNTRRLLLLLAVAVLGLSSCRHQNSTIIELKSEDDLSGLTVSCTAGNYYERKYSLRQDVKVFATSSEADAVQAVRQGLADVFVSDEVALTEERLKELGMKCALRGDEAFDVAFGIRKGNDKFRAELNKFIASSREDGTLDAVITHWIKGGPAVPFEEPKNLDKSNPVRCALCVNNAPISFVGEGGRWDGVDPEIVRRFAASIGRPVEFIYQDVGSANISLQAGMVDIMAACLYATEERKKSIDFSDNYYLCHPGFFTKDAAAAVRMTVWDRLKMSLVTEQRWKLITGGLVKTLVITLFSILLGTVLGAGVCAMKRSRRRWVRSLIKGYGAFIQGTPVLVVLLIMFYVIFAHSGLSGTVVAIFTFALFFAWSSGNIFDNSISYVPKGQTEAGLSLGFTPFKTFTGIVFPQALKRGLPMYAGECVSLLKSTSIVGYIAIVDLTRASDLIRSRTFDALIPLLIITITYFVLAWIVRSLLNLLLIKK